MTPHPRLDAAWFAEHAPNFSPDENWGDLSRLSPFVPITLQRIRQFYNAPIKVLDGCTPRPERPNSQHPLGLAVDFCPHIKPAGLTADEMQQRHLREWLRLFQICQSIWLSGFGVYPLGSHGYGYFHLDLRGDGAPARWTAYRNDCGELEYTSGIDDLAVQLSVINVARGLKA